MASLDNLVVTTALPSIRDHLHASLEGLQWTVNAYTLTFAVLLLTGATLGERYGRRRLFTIGLGLFTAGSAAAALAPGIGALVAARAVQGVGAAIVIPLTLTLLSAAVSPQRRGLALGAWGAVGGLAIAIGPLVGGAVVEGSSWQWIFWLNVPIGIALLPIARLRLTESRGPSTSLDLPGLVLASVGLLGIVLGVVRGNDHGWTSVTVLPPLVIGVLLVAAFIGWELRAREPMLPLHLFRSRGFAVTNLASLLMFFGMFGSIFLLAQFLQVVQHYSPLQAGLRTLPWTAMPVFIAPIAGALSDRIGGRTLLATGLGLQAIGLGWLAAVISPTVPYLTLVPAFVVSGVGMSLFFAPVANVVLSSVRRDQEGIASGANNAIRELGGVFGIAVLGAVFSARGGYASGTAFVSGLAPAVWVGAAAVAVAAAAALFLPRLRQAEASPAVEEVPRSWSANHAGSRARTPAGSGLSRLPVGDLVQHRLHVDHRRPVQGLEVIHLNPQPVDRDHPDAVQADGVGPVRGPGAEHPGHRVARITARDGHQHAAVRPVEPGQHQDLGPGPQVAHRVGDAGLEDQPAGGAPSSGCIGAWAISVSGDFHPADRHHLDLHQRQFPGRSGVGKTRIGDARFRAFGPLANAMVL